MQLIFRSFLTLAILLAPGSLSYAQNQNLSGPFEIIDAETIKIAGQKLKLAFISAPQPDDQCAYKSRSINCGRIATTALLDLVAGATVKCTPIAKTSPLARCWANGYELSEGMVYTGWARARPSAPVYFHKIEKTAKAKKRGLWKGKFPDSVEKSLAKKQN